MRRSTVVLTVLLLTIALMAAVPATAAPAPAGERVHLVAGTTEIPADTPFHVRHGWSLVPGEQTAIGNWGFSLDIDGVEQKGYPFQSVYRDPEFGMNRQMLFNFPDGLPAGTYELTGHWTGPCRQLVDAGWIAGPCEKPNASVEGFTYSLVLTVVTGP